VTFANINLTTIGLVFGAQPSLAFESTLTGISGPLAENTYNVMGAFTGSGGLGPTNPMYTSNPTATGAQLGTGIKVVGSTTTTNGAFEVFTAAQVLFGSPNGIGSRVYFGELVLTFNTAVKNPVIHINGLGGSYRYLPVGQKDVPGNYRSTFFTSELELQNTVVTSDSLSGNEFFRISGNNILNRNNANPNGASVSNPDLFDNYGASSGSVRINGTVTELVYKVYLKSGTSSQFAWSVPGSAVNVNNRDPFTGDVWYIAASYDLPDLQIISGNVFNDVDGLVDNNISQTQTSAGPIANATTNAGGLLYANLLNSAGLVVASQAIAANGAYLFDNLPAGTYSVQLTINPSAGTFASPLATPATTLHADWCNTG